MAESGDGSHAKVGPPIKVLSGWRRALPFYVFRSRRQWSVKVFPRVLLLWLLLLAAFAYVAGGTALYFNDRYRRNLLGISLWDRLYPPHWGRYQTARGDALIHNARFALDRGDLATAAHLLRAGLARSPENLTGRELLADIYLLAKREDLAEAVLLEGLRPDLLATPNEAFVRSTVAFLFRRQRDAAVVDLADQLLPRLVPDSEFSRFLVLARAHAFFFRGNFDQAETALRESDQISSVEGRILAARIEWERGFRELARVLIDQLAREFPGHAEIYGLQIAWLGESGEADRARRLSLLRRIDRPDELRPRLDLLFALHRSGDEAGVTAEGEALLHHFASDPNALLLLGDFAANAGRPDLADRAYAHAKDRGFPTSGLALMRVEALIVAARHREAIHLSNQLLEANPEWQTSLAPVFNGLQAIAHFALGDRESADLFLTDYLHQQHLRAENLVAVSQRFRAIGASQQAHTVLRHAIRLDPLNQPALSSLVRFELDLPEAPELGDHLTQLLRMRRPSPDLLRQAYATLGSDRFLLMAGRDRLLDEITRNLSGDRLALSP